MNNGVLKHFKQSKDLDEQNVKIQVTNPGILNLPAGGFKEMSAEKLIPHISKLVKTKGYQAIIRALNNLVVWNSKRYPELADKARKIQIAIQKKHGAKETGKGNAQTRLAAGVEKSGVLEYFQLQSEGRKALYKPEYKKERKKAYSRFVSQMRKFDRQYDKISWKDGEEKADKEEKDILKRIEDATKDYKKNLKALQKKYKI